MSTAWNENHHPRNRVGEFAEKAGSAPEVGLSETRDWGSTGVREGSRTPWGPADIVRDIGPGIVEVSTPGHGGVKLSPERNRLIPGPLRRASGWYEEDCEWHIPAAHFPDEFVAQRNTYGSVDPDSMFANADRLGEEAWGRVRQWFPDEYEKTTGEQVLPGQSSVRDEQLFFAAHQNDWVVTSASTSEIDPDMVRVTARVGAAKEEAEFLVPKGEYRTGKLKAGTIDRFVVDPARHPKLPPKPDIAAPEPKRHHQVPGYGHAAPAGQTAAASERIAKDMLKRWRGTDGSVRTLSQIIAEEGVTSKNVYVENGRAKYSVLQKQPNGTHYSFPVSKATFVALTGVPDDRSESTKASQAASVAWENAERLRLSAWSELERANAERASARARKLEEHADHLRTVETANHAGKHQQFVDDMAERERAAGITTTAVEEQN